MDVLLHLVRHGRPAIDPELPAGQWPLDPAGFTAIENLRELLPHTARASAWYSSDERKAVDTARRLTHTQVSIVPELREAARGGYLSDGSLFAEAVARALKDVTASAFPGWEPLQDTRRRVRQAVDLVTTEHAGDVTMVGHGTAWTLLIAELLGEPVPVTLPPMSMPDLLIIDLDRRCVLSPWQGIGTES